MPHFVILIEYKLPFAEFEPLVPSHRDYLQQGVERGEVLVSGPQNPRIGGVVIGRFADRSAVESFCAGDPYSLNGVADYRIIEFAPGRHQPFLKDWIA